MSASVTSLFSSPALATMPQLPNHTQFTQKHHSSSTAAPSRRAMMTSSASSTKTDSIDTSKPFCWICLEQDTDDEGRPLISGCCSCRGGSGHLHLSCVLQFIKTKTRDIVKYGRGGLADHWTKCFNCKQNWNGQMAKLIGNECSPFVTKEFAFDPMLKLTAYGIELTGLINSGISTLDEREYAATKILSSIDSIADIECYRFHSPFLLAQKALCHKIMGNILIERKKDPFLAIQHFNRSRDLIMPTIRNPAHEELILIDLRIAQAEAMLPGADLCASDKHILELRRAIYEEVKQKHGATSAYTRVQCWNFALALLRQGEFKEAEVLFSDLYIIVNRIHGDDHAETTKVKRAIEMTIRKAAAV